SSPYSLLHKRSSSDYWHAYLRETTEAANSICAIIAAFAKEMTGNLNGWISFNCRTAQSSDRSPFSSKDGGEHPVGNPQSASWWSSCSRPDGRFGHVRDRWTRRRPYSIWH